MIDWRDPRQREVSLTPTDKCLSDSDIHCYRPDGSLYVVVSRSEWRRLQEAGKLNSYLDEQRR